MGSINSSDPMYKTPLELNEALDLSSTSQAGPFSKRSPTLVEYAKGLRPLAVPAGLSVAEAASVFEVWMKDKAIVSGTVSSSCENSGRLT